MRTLVTGGAGFIGSHLVDHLIDHKHKVIVIDNFSTGNPENLAKHNNNPNLQVVEADVTTFKDVKEHFEGIDWVFHLAALADIVPSVQNPLLYHRNNVEGTVNVLEASRQADIKRFVYAASSSCYGIPDNYPTSENAPIRPQYPYALSKYLGELAVLHWGQVYHLPAVSLRFFNVYGPRARTSGTYGAVFGVFLAQKLANKPFTVVGDGSQTRDFTYVSDVAEACVSAAKSEIRQDVLNIGSGRTASINYLVELLNGKVVYIPKRPGEPDCTFADIHKIKKILGWVPKIEFEKGVEEMLANIDYWRAAPLWTAEKIEVETKDWFECLGRTT